MKSLPLTVTLLILIGLLATLGGTAPDEVRLTIKLIESPSQQLVPGLLRIRDEHGQIILPPELLPRGLGLKTPQLGAIDSRIHDWAVLPQPLEITLPRRKLTLEALSGLETEMTTRQLDLTGDPPKTIDLTLKRFTDVKARGWHSANTHLHLMKLSRDEADRYLEEIPRADRLDLLFVSYLERAGADHDYITNRLTANDLADLSSRTGIIFGNGEEHRHNLNGYGEGYGHVMFLDIAQLIHPVSLGPGIMKTGTDGIPLQRGIDAARRDRATILWCHNGMGLETLANITSGRVHAQNIFDGAVLNSYAEGFYPLLNAGFDLPFSTGTDWFIYDFSRVYTRATSQPHPISPQRTAGNPPSLSLGDWLTALKEGKTFITNGPLLEFRIYRAVDPSRTADIGDTLNLERPTSLVCTGSARSRSDFQQLELIRNGQVITTTPSKPVDNHFESQLRFELDLDQPAWFALRTPPPPLDQLSTSSSAAQPQTPPAAKPQLSTVNSPLSTSSPPPTNEFNRPIFSHTSPIHVTLDNRRYFSRPAAEKLLRRLEANRNKVASLAKFADPEERNSLLAIHDEAIHLMQEHLNLNP